MDEFLEDDGNKAGGGSSAWVMPTVAGLLIVLAAVAGGVYAWLKPEPGAAPSAVARDPLLAEGRLLYLQRCNSCHGELGEGDGPLGKSLQGPPPGDLTDGEWKHGDQPSQVLKVIREGVPGTSMAAWRVAFNENELRALAAYVYYLGGREIPEELRGG